MSSGTARAPAGPGPLAAAAAGVGAGEEAQPFEPQHHPRHDDADDQPERELLARVQPLVSIPPAEASSTRTMGSARPSLTPDSTLSRCRSRGGTSSRPTMAAAKTGSVGESTAPSRSDSSQGSPATQCASAAVTSSVSGSPSTSARPGSRQALRRSRRRPASRRCKAPRTARARPAPTRRGHRTATRRTSSTPGPSRKPPTRNSTAVDSTVRLASSDSSTATTSNAEKQTSSTGMSKTCVLTRWVCPVQRTGTDTTRQPLGHPRLQTTTVHPCRCAMPVWRGLVLIGTGVGAPTGWVPRLRWCCYVSAESPPRPVKCVRLHRHRLWVRHRRRSLVAADGRRADAPAIGGPAIPGRLAGG